LWQSRFLHCFVLRVYPACPSLAVLLVLHTSTNKNVQMRTTKSMRGPGNVIATNKKKIQTPWL
jgi:hypothetical protein